MKKYPFKGTLELIQDMCEQGYSKVFGIQFGDNGAGSQWISCPSIPSKFSDDCYVEFEVYREVNVGIVTLNWKQK